MTLQEAIKSGRKFRRKVWMNRGYWLCRSGGLILEGGEAQQVERYQVEVDDILATDWELKPEELEYVIVSHEICKATRFDHEKSSIRLVDERLCNKLVEALELLGGLFYSDSKFNNAIKGALAEYRKFVK